MGLFDVSADKKESKDIIKITVASGSEKPYYKRKHGMSEKGCYIRIGAAADPMPQKMINELFAKRTRDSIGKIKSSHQDLNFEQVTRNKQQHEVKTLFQYKLSKILSSKKILTLKIAEHEFNRKLMRKYRANKNKKRSF